MFKRIYDEIKTGIESQELRGEKYFAQHHDPEVARIVADIISNRYELSPKWREKRVYTSTEVDKLELAVMQSIYSFKSAKVSRELELIKKELFKLFEEDPDGSVEDQRMLLAKQNKLEKVKGLLTNNDSLGRVIH